MMNTDHRIGKRSIFKRASRWTALVPACLGLLLAAGEARAGNRDFRTLDKLSSTRLAIGGEFEWQGWKNFIVVTDTGRALEVGQKVRVDGPVEGIVEVGSKLYIWGKFETVNGQPHRNVAQIDENTGAVASWSLDYDDDFTVTAAKRNGAYLYVSGRFKGGFGAQTHYKNHTYRFSLSDGSRDAQWSTNRAASVIRIHDGDMFYAQGYEVSGTIWKVGTEGSTATETEVFKAGKEVVDFVVRDDGFYVLSSRRSGYGSSLSGGTWVQRHRRADGELLWAWKDERTAHQLHSWDDHKRIGAIGGHVVVMFDDGASRFRGSDGQPVGFQSPTNGESRCGASGQKFDDFYFTNGDFLVVGDGLYRCRRHTFGRVPRFFEGEF